MILSLNPSLSKVNPKMDLFSLLTLLSILLIPLYCLFFLHKTVQKQTKTVAGFKNYPILGTIPEFIQNRHRFLDWVTDALSNSPTNTAVFWGPDRLNGVCTANPLNVEHALKTNFDNYPKGDQFNAPLQDFFGLSIFTSDGEPWKFQRRIASHEFSTNSLRNFVVRFVKAEVQQRLIPLLENAAANCRVLDMTDVLERFAFDNICKLAFDLDPSTLTLDGSSSCSEFMEAFDEATRICADRFMYASPMFYKIKRFLNIGSEKKLKKAIKTVHEFADRIIKTRMEQKAERKGEDLLSRFMGSSEDPTFLRDVVTGFLVAGRDTTSTALTWFFWILSSHPEVERKIIEELEAIRLKFGKNIGDTYEFDELREMHYLQASISECMRLYPPVAVDTKTCLKDDILPDGTFIGKGWFFSYYTYAMGRMENVWGKDCSEYKPERWLENGIYKKESPYKYPVFHGGPRMCLGKDMTYFQMKSIAASVLERFEIEVLLDKNKCPEYLLAMTFKLKGGLPVRVKERGQQEV